MHRLAFAALLGSGTLCGSALAQERMAVTFATNWLPQAEHGGYYQALADGTYAECGLDVTILPGGPQVNNRALLVAGRVEFYMGGNLLRAFNAVAEGIPLKVVAAHFQKEPQILMTHPGQGLDTFEDLKGIPLYLDQNGFQSFYRWMIDAHGFEADQRRVYTYNPAPFLANPRSGQQGYLTSEPFAIEQAAGFTPNIFLIADYGFDSYSTTVEAMDAFIAENPEAVRCFVDGSALGWTNYLYGDPSAGDALIREANPDMTEAQLAYSREKLVEHGIVFSGDAQRRGIGAIDPERVEKFYEAMVSAGVSPEGLDPTDILDLSFANRGVGLERMAELTD